MKLPGKARRNTVTDEITIPDDAMPLASPYGPTTVRGGQKGIDPKKLDGLVIDDSQAKRIGNWTAGTGLAGFVGDNYLYNQGEASIRFEFEAPASGKHDIRISYQPHQNRGRQVPVVIAQGGQEFAKAVNMQKKPPLAHGFISVGEFNLAVGEPITVTLSTQDAGGLVHADAVQVLKAP